MANTEHIKWLLEGVEAWNARRERQPFKPDLKDKDLYEVFNQAGKLSDSGRINLAGINLRRADLKESRLSCRFNGIGPDFTGANLSWADFEDAQLFNSKLDRTNLFRTSFRRANLQNSSFLEVKMAGTILDSADLSKANLTGVKMPQMSLANAILSYATLEGTDMRQVNLVGADLSFSHPWEAKLYPKGFSSTSTRLQVTSHKSISSVSDLLKLVNRIGDRSAGNVVYLRGEGAHYGKLQPKVMRSSENGEYLFRTKESDMLMELMTRRPEDFGDSMPALSQWVLAQHHGLPTRLLDVTRNPLVALFWACQSDNEKPGEKGQVHIFSVPKDLVKPFNSDTISIIANFAKLPISDKNLLLGWTLDEAEARAPKSPLNYIYEHSMQGLYQLICLEKPYFDKRIDPRDLFRVFVVEPKQSFERIRAQAGAFLVSAFHERFERSRILKWNEDIPIYDHHCYMVPSEAKKGILNDLRLLNITRETLLPGLDETARAVMAKVKEETD